jgi:hypothetical protein
VGIRVNVEMVRSWRRFRNITMVNANKCSIGKKKKKKKKTTTQRSLFCPFFHKEGIICDSENRPLLDTESASASVSDFSASRTVRNKPLLFISHLAHGILLKQTKQAEVFKMFCFQHLMV